MPKKYHQKSLLTKPSPLAAPSLSSSRVVSPTANEPVQQRSVNDLLRESRTQGLSPRPIEAAAPTSVPLPLRAVFDIPPSLTPPPPALGPTRLRRIPGPPPPRSWLIHSSHAPQELKASLAAPFDQCMRIQTQSCKLPGGHFPPSQSLRHLALKQLATQWEWHAEVDHIYLNDLPAATKEVLLSYISIYDESHTTNPLRLLFPAELEDIERQGVERLDLSNAIGLWASLKTLERDLGCKPIARTVDCQENLPNNDQEIPDSWDVESDSATEATEIDGNSIPILRPRVRFTNLKHLSLAVAPGTKGSVASWSLLLSLAAQMPTITSLSLAHWPAPTYTPNASKGRFKISAPGAGRAVIYGGSNYYTSLDNDWREAAGILRSLSRSLYCLTWLDLTGCGEWLQALTWRNRTEDEEGLIHDSGTGPDWNGSWREIKTLIIAVGWSPHFPSSIPKDISTQKAVDPQISSERGERHYNIANRHAEALSALELLRLGQTNQQGNEHPENWDVEEERRQYYFRKEVELHRDLKRRAQAIAQELRSIRREHGGKWMDFDFGSEKIF